MVYLFIDTKKLEITILKLLEQQADCSSCWVQICKVPGIYL